MVYHGDMRSWLAVVGNLVARLRLAVRLLREPAVPLAAKLVPALGLAYLIFPLDVVPDFLPILGQLDDLGVILIALEMFVHLCPPTVVQFHQAAMARGQHFQPMPRATPASASTTGPIIDAEFRVDSGKR
jgi:uncharacterized membrane protein YkvA (DUF1232 family)